MELGHSSLAWEHGTNFLALGTWVLELDLELGAFNKVTWRRGELGRWSWSLEIGA
jgi:hypothetical protein